jgi:hypothetical protein
MKTNPSPIVIAAVVLACLCIGLCAAAGVVGFFINTARGVNLSVEPGQAPPTMGPSAESQDDTGDTDTIPPEIASQMDAIQMQVIQIRGLQPSQSLTRTLYTTEDLRDRVINDFFADYSEEEARDDTRLLAVFGLLENDFDLSGFITELYSEQIAGFYDDESNEMVIVQGESFSGPEKITYAHEYMHALQDQNFDFDEGLQYDEDSCETEAERCTAVLALIEGEASLLELEWLLGYASNQDRQEIFDFYNDFDSPMLDSAPAYMQEDFIFPYEEGYFFAQALFDKGGWAALDAAFANPPVTTEQILHPEKYPDEIPQPVTLPDLAAVLGSGWEVYDDNILGEWYTYLVLAFGINPQARISDATAAEAAEGWGGDRYQALFSRETDQIAMALATTWDTQEDALEFAQAFESYADARYGARNLDESRFISWEGPAQTAIFFHQGLWTYWISAPDRTAAEAILDAIQNP